MYPAQAMPKTTPPVWRLGGAAEPPSGAAPFEGRLDGGGFPLGDTLRGSCGHAGSHVRDGSPLSIPGFLEQILLRQEVHLFVVVPRDMHSQPRKSDNGNNIIIIIVIIIIIAITIIVVVIFIISIILVVINIIIIKDDKNKKIIIVKKDDVDDENDNDSNNNHATVTSDDTSDNKKLKVSNIKIQNY